VCKSISYTNKHLDESLMLVWPPFDLATSVHSRRLEQTPQSGPHGKSGFLCLCPDTPQFIACIWCSRYRKVRLTGAMVGLSAGTSFKSRYADWMKLSGMYLQLADSLLDVDSGNKTFFFAFKFR
jgi:hypothetical protein